MQHYVVAAHAGKREKERSGKISGAKGSEKQRNEDEENKMRNCAHHSSFKHIFSAILLIILLYPSGRRKKRCLVFWAQCVVRWCPVGVLLDLMFLLSLLLNAVLDRRSV